MSVDEKTERLPLIKKTCASQRDDETRRIVRKYMDDFVVRPALDRGRDDDVVQAWKNAASAGR